MPTASAVPAPRAAVPQIPTPRGPVDQATVTPVARPGRHRIVDAGSTAPRATRSARPSGISGLVTLAARAGSIVTLAAMLVAAVAAAGLTDGVAPSGDAATVASSTLR